MPKREPGPLQLQELVTCDMSESQSPLARKISKANPDGVDARNQDILLVKSELVTRKRKRSLSPQLASEEDAVDPFVPTSANPYPGVHVDDYCTTIDRMDNFQQYLDSLAEGYDALNLHDNQAEAGTFTLDSSKQKEIDLCDKNLILPAAEEEDGSDADADSVSDQSNKDEEDSNDEGNWRNDYPDEENYFNNSDDSGGNSDDEF